MRYVLLKSIPNAENPQDPFSYRDHLFVMTKRRSPGRDDVLDWDEMNRIQSLVKKVEKAKDGDMLVLEESEWEHAVRKVKKFDWPLFTEEAFNFIADLSHAPDTDPREKEKSLAAAEAPAS